MREKQVTRTSKKAARSDTPVSPFDTLADAEPMSVDEASTSRGQTSATGMKKAKMAKNGESAKAVKNTKRPSSQVRG